MSRPGCYASSLGDCEGALTEEHYISHAILRLLSDGGGRIRTAGMPFAKGNVLDLPPSRLSAKVLCERHNQGLSPIDAEALKLFQIVSETDGLAQAIGHLGTTTLNGNLIERWLLKVFLGLIAAGFGRTLEGQHVARQVPERLVRVLFGRQSHIVGHGIYLSGALGDTFSRESHGISLVADLAADLTPAILHFDFDRLHLRYVATSSESVGVNPENYRPHEIRFVHARTGASRHVRFRWLTKNSGRRWVQMKVGTSTPID
jgi:hypothetical protein